MRYSVQCIDEDRGREVVDRDSSSAQFKPHSELEARSGKDCRTVSMMSPLWTTCTLLSLIMDTILPAARISSLSHEWHDTSTAELLLL
jgi:hypothetical protein